MENINIFINAGHHNNDKGALGFIEGNEVNKIRDAIKRKYSAGLYISDSLNLRQSIDWVNNLCETQDIAIDIHLNKNTNKWVNGTEVYYYKNKELARKFSKAISEKISVKNGGAIPDTKSYVRELGWVRQLKCRSVVIECLYISNSYDRSRLDYEKIADAIISVFTMSEVVSCKEEKQLIRQLINFISSFLKKK